MVRPPHQGECGVTRNPWNEAGWVYDSETNTLSGREQEGVTKTAPPLQLDVPVICLL